MSDDEFFGAEPKQPVRTNINDSVYSSSKQAKNPIDRNLFSLNNEAEEEDHRKHYLNDG